MNLQKKPLLAALASLPFLFLLSCSKQPAAQPPPSAPSPAEAAIDASTPKRASQIFAGAMVSGDAEKMRAVSVGADSKALAFYISLAEMVGAQRKFKLVLSAKFGDSGALPAEIEAIGSMNPNLPDEASWTQEIKGDSATLVDASGNPGLKFKKVDGNWKVDFTATDAALPAGGAENMARQQQTFVATKRAFDEATQKIIDGSYADPKAAVDDVMSMIKGL